MERRHLLAGLAGSALSLSGCAGSRSFGTATTEPNRSTAAGSNPTSDSITVHSLDLRRTILLRGVHTDPFYRPDQQFVVADVSVDGRGDVSGFAVSRAFSVVADGERVDTDVSYPATPITGDPEGIQLAFAVPAPLDADGVSLVWTGDVGTGGERRWSLDSKLLDALANPPAFEVSNFEVPDEVERGAVFDIEFTVANVGSADGTFLAELGATTVSDTPEITVEVSKGETVTTTRTVEPHYPESADELMIRLNWGSSSVEQTVVVA